MLEVSAIMATLTPNPQSSTADVQSSDMPESDFSSVLSDARSSAAEETAVTDKEKTESGKPQAKAPKEEDDAQPDQSGITYLCAVIPAMQVTDIPSEEIPPLTEEPALAEVPLLTYEPVLAEEPALAKEPALAEEPVLKEEPVSEKEPVLEKKPIAEKPALSQPEEEKPVITILESNMDMDTSEPEVTARMPQTTGPITKKTETADKAVSVEDDSLCPLENDNDPILKTGNSERPGAESGKKDTASENPSETEAAKFNIRQTVNISPERVFGAQQLDSAAAESRAPVTTDKLFDVMVERIEMFEIDGQSEMEIQLKPEFLGKVSIQLSLGSSGLEVKIKADDVSVKELIAGQLSVLSETLSEKGIKVNSVDVLYAESQSQQFDQSRSGGGGREQRSGRSTAIEGIERSALAATSWEDEMGMLLDSSISSVEYRA